MIPDSETDVVFLADLLQARFPDLYARVSATLVSYGVEVRVLTGVRDIWARDFSPVQIGEGKLVQFRYEPDYLAEYPELRTGRDVAVQFSELGECRHCEINLDGGNVVSTKRRAILTEKIYRENPEWERRDLRAELRQILEVDELIVVPKEPYDPIGHTDAMVRFINESAVLVNDYAVIDPAFGQRFIKVLTRHGLKAEKLPYSHQLASKGEIPSAVGCYTNFLRTSTVILVPEYGIFDDGIALAILRSVFPDVPVVPVECSDLAKEGGVLNCITSTYRRTPKSL